MPLLASLLTLSAVLLLARPAGSDAALAGRPVGRCEPYATICRHCADCSQCGHCAGSGGKCSVCFTKR